MSLSKCVGIHSKLAAGYVRTLPRKRIVVVLPPAKPIEAPEIEVLRERLAHPLPLAPSDLLLSRAAELTAEVR